MYLEFHGAAEGVTGSLHRVRVGEVDILLDAGLFQGHREESNRKNRVLPPWASGAHALVLSHAHLDHSGNVPSLVRHGFRGNIYATPATRDLASVMLRDAAMIQQQDAVYLNKKLARAGARERIEPLYGPEDVAQSLQQMIAVPWRRPMTIAPGVTMILHDAGHVLGSSMVELELEEDGRRVRLLYTGDLGRAELPLLHPPAKVQGVDVLLMESTYGDRHHPDPGDASAQLGKIIRSTLGRGGRVYIPSFALERAQEVLYALDQLQREGAIPEAPIYVDSPLTIAVTEIYKLHPEALDPAVRDRLLDRDDPFSPKGLRYVSDIASSMQLQQSGEPCIIIAGSGMCEGGRILHHFTRGLGDSKNSVVIVGFMAQHTLGRRLLEGRRKVKVFGLDRDVWCEVHALPGLSAHADRDGLLDFARETARLGHLRTIALVHGELDARRSLAKALKAEDLAQQVVEAEPGERLELAPGKRRK